MRVPPAAIYVPEEDRKAILAQIDEALKTGQLTLGKIGRQFEEEFAAACGTRYAIAVNSGTSAIEIVLRAIGVEGREVLIPANTFFATAAAAAHAGAKVRFLDCAPETFAIDADDLERQISPETAAVVIVHIGGIVSADIARIKAICEARGVPLVEDAAHAHGSSLGGVMAGAFGKAATFSFYPTKVITSAEGGMIVTDDEALYQEALIYRDQGKAGFTTNFHTRLGSNWRLSEVHAAIGLAQFRRLGEFIDHRNAIARIYDEELGRIEGIRPVRSAEGSRNNYYKYIAMLPDGVDRAALKKALRENHDVGLSGEVYETPLHIQPVFEQFRDRDLPGAERICARHICLPVSAVMTEDDARYTVESLATALAAAR